LAVVCS